MKQTKEASTSYAGPNLFINLSAALAIIISLLILGADPQPEQSSVSNFFESGSQQTSRMINQGHPKRFQTASKYETDLSIMDPIKVSLVTDAAETDQFRPENNGWSESDYLANLNGSRPKIEMGDFLDRLKSTNNITPDINDVLKSLHDSHANRDMRQVVDWVNSARKSIHGMAYEIADQFRKQADYTEAYRWYYIAVKDAPSPQTYYQLAAAGMLGQGTSVNYDQAKRHLYQAVRNHHADAAYLLGICYLSGLATESNNAFAYQWFQKSIAKGGTSGFAEAGRMRELGKGIKQNKPRALEIYQRGAELGDPYCIYRLKMLKGEAMASLEEDPEVRHLDITYVGKFSHLLPEGFLF